MTTSSLAGQNGATEEAIVVCFGSHQAPSFHMKGTHPGARSLALLHLHHKRDGTIASYPSTTIGYASTRRSPCASGRELCHGVSDLCVISDTRLWRPPLGECEQAEKFYPETARDPMELYEIRQSEHNLWDPTVVKIIKFFQCFFSFVSKIFVSNQFKSFTDARV